MKLDLEIIRCNVLVRARRSRTNPLIVFSQHLKNLIIRFTDLDLRCCKSCKIIWGFLRFRAKYLDVEKLTI